MEERASISNETADARRFTPMDPMRIGVNRRFLPANGPYSFKFWFEEGQSATNPEELIGAAHAGRFTKALTAQLSRARITPTRIHTGARVKLEKAGEAFSVTQIELETEAEIPANDDATFQKYALDAKQNCPV